MLRLVHFVVQPVLVVDDGDELAPGPHVEPHPLTLTGLRDLVENWPAHLARLQAQAADPEPEAASNGATAMRETRP